MITVSLTHPPTHPRDPYVVAEKYWNMYPNGSIEPPRFRHTQVEVCDPHSQSLYNHYFQDKCVLSEEDDCNARRGYYSRISHPELRPGRVTASASLPDIFTTFLDIAGIPVEQIQTRLDSKRLIRAIQGHATHAPVLAEHIDGGRAH